MTNHKNQTLTRAELQVMEVLWSVGKACDVHEVVERYAEPRPAYTTISTFMSSTRRKNWNGATTKPVILTSNQARAISTPTVGMSL